MYIGLERFARVNSKSLLFAYKDDLSEIEDIQAFVKMFATRERLESHLNDLIQVCDELNLDMAYNYGAMFSVITGSISNSWLPWFQDNYFVDNCEVIKINARKLVGGGCYIGLGGIAMALEAMYILGGSSYEAGVVCVMPTVLGGGYASMYIRIM